MSKSQSKDTNSKDTKLKKIKLSKIKPYNLNARDNNKYAVQAVVESIKRYGYTNPIIVDEKNVIIAGHTRYLALKELNFDEVEVIVSKMREDEAKEYRIIDNKTNELSQWDEKNLQFELREFEQRDYAQELFPEIKDNIKIQDTTEYDIDEKDFERIEKKLGEDFEEKMNKKISSDNFLEIKCPHCGRTFLMPIPDLLHKFKIEKLNREQE